MFRDIAGSTRKSNDIVVTWTTFHNTHESTVEYGVDYMNKRASGKATVFKDGAYHAGSEYGWSELFFFHVPPQGTQWPVRAAIYGDMGNKNARSLSYLQDETERGNFDLILHVGDFAYNMHDDNGRRGDQFMRQIQPIAALVPYMTCPGNHEAFHNFSNYKARFSMPGTTEGMFYSFDLGPVHFVSISTEYYYFYKKYGTDPLYNQFHWLEKELAKADKNRAEHPWIVLMGHRPMYCSNKDDVEDCSDELTRVGVPRIGLGLETMLKQYAVDLVIWAHEHSYERSWPLFNSTVYNGTKEEPYRNPRAPVHIITGSAGCQEDHDPFFMDLKGKVIDSFWLIKDKLSFNMP
ncbi:hypothetical protein MSG28_004851 [Choristoneura fumiferana]|uniref:Uncharacterized protein n=1 Tax=Choristoneura fumiferana TaxID=7141 RepID=A0ACC0K7U4_CHOFU|nr:hypothetical protein MSG28_004851 [Choristoneura fumiferana]